jgi:hypothetical protein
MLRLLMAFLGSALATSASADVRPVVPGEEAQPLLVTVEFDTKDSVSFHLTKDAVSLISFRVLNDVYTLSLESCTPITDVRFETAMLYWGSAHDERVHGTFTLTFRMGFAPPGQARRLSMVQISFRNGKPIGVLGPKWTADGEVMAPLCLFANGT